jgi:signal transduction histidine kinase
MPTASSEPSLRERIGGRWAVSWVAFLVLVVLGLGATAMHGPASFRDWAVLVATSTAALGAVFVLAHLTVLRGRTVRPVAVWVVVVVALVAGEIRAGALLITADALDEPLARPWQFVLLSNALVAPLVVVGVALLLDQINRLRDRRAALQARLIALREQQLERTDLTDAITDVAHAEVVAALEDVRNGLDVPVAEMDADERLAVAGRLRALVDESLRPLSHRLYDAGSRGSRDAASTAASRWAGLRTIPVLPLPSAAVATIVAAPVVTNLASAFVLGGTTWLALALVVRASARSLVVRRRELVVAAGVLALAGIAATLAIRAVVGSNHPITVVLWVAFALPLIMVMVGAFGAVVRGEEFANARLAEEVSAREINALVANRELARASRQLAEYVHGTVQAHLLTTAFTLERAAETGEVEALDDAMRAAREALTAESATRAPARDLVAELDTVASLWRGFVTVTTRLDHAVPALAPATVADIGRIAGEAVANARKHGGARNAEIAVDAVPEGVRVLVTDDGTGPLGGVPGMGSAWLDFIAPGRWVLEPGHDGSGARLQVTLLAPASTGAADTVMA